MSIAPAAFLDVNLMPIKNCILKYIYFLCEHIVIIHIWLLLFLLRLKIKKLFNYVRISCAKNHIDFNARRWQEIQLCQNQKPSQEI